MTGFRDSLCDTQPVSELTESDEVFAVEVPPACASDLVVAVVVNIDTSSSLRSVLCLIQESKQGWRENAMCPLKRDACTCVGLPSTVTSAANEGLVVAVDCVCQH